MIHFFVLRKGRFFFLVPKEMEMNRIENGEEGEITGGNSN